jgi:hypothetical protein
MNSKNMKSRFHVVSAISTNASEAFWGGWNTCCSIILQFINPNDGTALIKDILEWYLSSIRILCAILENVSDTLFWMDYFETIMSSKGCQLQRIIRHDSSPSASGENDNCDHVFLCVRPFLEDNRTDTYPWEVGNVWNEEVSDLRWSVDENRTPCLGH